jgi:lipoate-protein ligase A
MSGVEGLMSGVEGLVSDFAWLEGAATRERAARYHPQPLAAAAFQLAIDEAMLLAAEAGEMGQSLRVWEIPHPAVVLGRSSKVDLETDRVYCDQCSIPILRRCSGGAAIVAGPGCLMYSVVVSTETHPEAARIDGAHALVVERLLAAVRRQLPDADWQGICDLTWQDRKFSGNALRMARRHVLYHGTILYRADLARIEACLDHAPRQPDYRRGRSHQQFITNAPLDPSRLESDLSREFSATRQSPDENVFELAEKLAADRYLQDRWRYRH